MPIKPQLHGKTYHIRTYGCQMNLHDSERVAGLLDSYGCIEAGSFNEADIAVFMTCCVRENADNKLYGHVSELVSMPEPASGKRVVAIGGCIAQRDGEAMRSKMANVDVVFGTQAIARLPELLAEAFEGTGELYTNTDEPYEGFSADLPSRRESHYHAWVPIMTGCNNFCSYCIVPHVRGRENSRMIETIAEECRQLVSDGVREITLLGQNVNSYGRNIYGDTRFDQLLREVAATGIERLRFTSSNPKDLNTNIMDSMAELDCVMPHLHLAVQSGSDRILRMMHRSYTRDNYLNLVSELRNRVGDIALSTDIIVGFPGETDQDFEDTLSLVNEVGFASAFTFIYSPREGTPAARMENNASPELISERFQRLAKLVEDLAFKANQPYKGQLVESLVEGVSKRDNQVLVGHSPRNQTVHFPVPEGCDPQSLVGKLCDVRVEQARTWYLSGSMEGSAR